MITQHVSGKEEIPSWPTTFGKFYLWWMKIILTLKLFNSTISKLLIYSTNICEVFTMSQALV